MDSLPRLILLLILLLRDKVDPLAGDLFSSPPHNPRELHLRAHRPVPLAAPLGCRIQPQIPDLHHLALQALLTPVLQPLSSLLSRDLKTGRVVP
ncbi:hypothetical protein EDC04DRAFT_2663732 [Pisolithus marmoratus]|nr:hypothetical protein EDC04DRAFT_2663732 [Pisolithus marmoratus]